jgi:nucleoside-diphosphate-sugar epimerase
MAKEQKVLLIGATGFTGRCIVEKVENYNTLLKKKEDPLIDLTVFCRPNSEPPKWSDGSTIKTIRGDLNDVASLKNALHGKDGLMYAASLGFGHAPNIVTAAEEEGIKRAIFISTTAIFTKLNVESKRARMQAEATIVSSNLDWTILRPTMIYGRKGDRNMERLLRYLKRWPVIFCPGSGQALQQPVFVDDVASSVISSYFCKEAVRKSYNISGKNHLSFRAVVQKASEALGKKRHFISLPLAACCLVLSVYELLVKNPRIKKEQILRLNENKSFDHSSATVDFGYEPIGFEEGIKHLAKELQTNG